MCTPNLDSLTPPYIQIHSKTFGVRFLTSIATTTTFRSFCASWPRFYKKKLFISQPTIPLPHNLIFASYQPESAYIPAGWLFLSTSLVPILELQDNVTLEFLKINPEYCWMNDPIRILCGTATEVIDVSVSNKIPGWANCLWIHVRPDIPDTLIRSFIRYLFSREVENRPLCRPLLFMPDSFLLENDLVAAWNKIIPIQLDYFHQAEHGSFTNSKVIDPYDFMETIITNVQLKLVNGLSEFKTPITTLFTLLLIVGIQLPGLKEG
jgi:hypothetical protein